MSAHITPARGSERTESFTTLSGEPIAPLYGPDDVGPFEERIGKPGEFPFTRGIYPTMYRGRLWTMRQFAGFGTPEETNERFHYLLEHGQTGLSTALTTWRTCSAASTSARSRCR
jgi:methylmalonyl-CoA mutase N-terminal domain/subunit